MTCTTAVTVLTEDEIRERLARINGWSLSGNCIEKRYKFNNFLRAMSFLNAVAFVAESMNHHPDINLHYNEVTLRNWTHTAGGVTQYDFALAERIDAFTE